MDSETKKRILSAYLGKYQTRISSEIRALLKDVSPGANNLILTPAFREAVSYLLLTEGRKNYKVLTSSEVIDIYLGKCEGTESFRDLVMETLIVISHPAEMPNARRWDLVFQLAFERFAAGRSMTVVSASIPPENVKAFRDLGFRLVSAKDSDTPKSGKQAVRGEDF